MAESIEQLRIYKSARGLEDQIYELVKKLPPDQFYGLGNDLRRASGAVSHHIMEAHRSYSYRLKMESLAQARQAAESIQRSLASANTDSATAELVAGYVGVIKQSWGLSKWLKTKLAEREQTASVDAKDELVAARSF